MRRGRFEEAEGGTLFLDEIGDMPTELQTRLLRVLSDSHFYRVGGHTPIKANVRVIAATHQHLEDHVKQGLFREDLYHRLNVIRLRLPPLRERSEDIPLLARHFLQKSAASLGVDAKRLSPAAMKCIRDYPFPGNVRQLENLCQWITVMAPGQTVEISDLPPEIKTPQLEDEPSAASHIVSQTVPLAPTPPHSPRTSDDWVQGLYDEIQQRLEAGESGIADDLTQRFEACCIRASLAYTAGRKMEAAQLLGWGRNTLTRKIQELGMATFNDGNLKHG